MSDQKDPNQSANEALAQDAAPETGKAPAEPVAAVEDEAPAQDAAPETGEAPAEPVAAVEDEAPAQDAAPATGETPVDAAASAANGTTVEAATQAEERAGVATSLATAEDIAGTADPDEEQIDNEAAAQKRRNAEIEFLRWEELLEELKTIDARYGENPTKAYLEKYSTALNKHFRDSFVIPKVDSSSSQNNGHLFSELVSRVTLGNLGNSLFTVFKPATESGSYRVSDKGIFFKANKNEATKQKNPLTESEARGIALLAMHNKDLLPPGALRITGNIEEKALIKLEIDKLNESLPENARMIIKNADEINAYLLTQKKPAAAPKANVAEQPAPPAQAADATDGTNSNTAAEAATGASSKAAANELRSFLGDADDNNGEKVVTSTEPPVTGEAGKVSVEIQVADDDSTVEKSTAELQLEKISSMVANADKDNITKWTKPAGETEDGQQAYKVKLRIDDAPERAFTHVIFTAPDEGDRKIISIAKTDFYAGFESSEIKLKAPEKDPFEAAFAASSKDSSTPSTGAVNATPPAAGPVAPNVERRPDTP